MPIWEDMPIWEGIMPGYIWAMEEGLEGMDQAEGREFGTAD